VARHRTHDAACFADWNARLRGNVPNLREGFRQLLTTPIRFTPVVERGYRAIKVEGRIGLSEVFAGTLATNMASPTGFEPVFWP
jgi:hypothetical protein